MKPERVATLSFMKSSNLITWLLVAACVAIDLAIAGELQVRRNEWPEAGGLIGLGLTFSQVTMLAMWTVNGRTSILVRGVVSLVAVWMLGCLAEFSTTGRYEGAGMWFGVLMFYCTVSLVPFVLVRLTGYALANDDSRGRTKTRVGLSANQFSLFGILSLTTAIGITLGIVRFAVFPVGQLLGVAAFFTVLGATSCTLLLLSLYLRRIAFAIAASIVLCPTTGAVLSLTKIAPGEGMFELMIMMCVQGSVLVAAAVVLRSVGYRLISERSLKLPTAAESSASLTTESEGQGDEL
ncbi:MAG: hypothetical protein H6822_14725 [Planctomycetaceae bacterium]|nr:hypothetical protein [Planctomycetales bacterium]MCB9923434.1 hypothetical protein [Planctomycetaceae bacterium]